MQRAERSGKTGDRHPVGDVRVEAVHMAGDKVVITTFKNEAPYILEWVAHYKTLGFDKIIVFTNDCSDGTNRILRRLDQLGDVIFRINKVGPGGVHRSALRQARRMDVVKNAEWIFVCDIDEFLNIHVGNNKVDDLIDATGTDVDAIAIPWKLFSNNGRSILRNGLVTAQFTDAELPPVEGGATRRFVKTLFKQSEMIGRIGLHGPVLRKEFADRFIWAVPGGAHKSRESIAGHVSPPFGGEIAQLNHYAVRSVESYLLKRYRGRANHMSQTLDTEYWSRWNRGGSEDKTILRYLPEIKRRVADYKKDEVLSRLHRRAFRWHKNLVDELSSQEDYAALKKKCQKILTRIPPLRERPGIRAREATPMPRVMEHAKSSALPPIGSLWIGSALSYIEQMCLLSFVQQGHAVTLFTYGPVANVPRDIVVADAREIHDPATFLYSKFGTPVLQSDIFRLNMVRKTGMVWADADMFALKPVLADTGHVHGVFGGSSVCNAILKLPEKSPALSAYLAYCADPYPIPPWWDDARRIEAGELKRKGAWKHASDQSHDIYGPPALTHFLKESGEIEHSAAREVYYPVAFKELDLLIEPSDVETTHFMAETRAVHLWARRLRWRLPQLGLQDGSFIHSRLKELDLNPEAARLEHEKSPDPLAAARLLPRCATAKDIVETCEIPLNARQTRGLSEPNMDAAIREAEKVLREVREKNLYGLRSQPSEGRMRGIDHHGTGAQGAFRLANSIARYAHHHKALPDLIAPRNTTEKLIVWKHFGEIPVPPPADKLAAETFVPRDLRNLLRTPDRPWISDKPSLPRSGEIPDGVYYLKANHSHGAQRVIYPITDEIHEARCISAENGLAKPHGFWGSEWWYMHIPRKVFLERHLVEEDTTQEVADWKFWTIGGRVVLVQVDQNRFSGHIQLVHDRGLNFIPEPLYFTPGDAGAPRPERYDDMVAIAEGIGRTLDFARVDLYDTPAGLVLGEITLCPMGGCRQIKSAKLDAILSDAWDGTALFKQGNPAFAA